MGGAEATESAVRGDLRRLQGPARVSCRLGTQGDLRALVNAAGTGRARSHSQQLRRAIDSTQSKWAVEGHLRGASGEAPWGPRGCAAWSAGASPAVTLSQAALSPPHEGEAPPGGGLLGEPMR